MAGDPKYLKYNINLSKKKLKPLKLIPLELFRAVSKGENFLLKTLMDFAPPQAKPERLYLIGFSLRLIIKLS